MANRVRLTTRQAAAEGAKEEINNSYPGTVNQEERKFVKRDKYDTFEQTVNHELPDMRTEWKKDQKMRDEIGFGIPKVAKIYASAQKAVRLAVLFLGDKCEDGVIEEQARDFMRLGSVRIERALKRFAETEQMYEADDSTEIESTPEPAPAPEPTPAPAPAPEAKEVQAENQSELGNAAPKVGEDNAVNEGEEVQPVSKEQEKMQQVAVVAEDEEKDEESDSSVCAEEENDEEECTMAMDEVIAEDSDEMSEDNAELASVFADDISEGDATEEGDEDETVTTASMKKAKKGVKTLGGQPTKKVASANDLVDLWNDVPDVSAIF